MVIPGFVWVGLSVMSLSFCRSGEEQATLGPPLAQDVQVDRRGFAHSEHDLLNVLNVQSLLRFPLPAAQHDVVHLFRTNPWPIQNPALGYALNNLQRRQGSGVRQTYFH